MESYVHSLSSSFPQSAEMATPDGHRAPIAELLSMGCPSDRVLSGSPTDSYSENRFVRISEDFQDNLSMRTSSDMSYMSAVHFGELPSAGKTSSRYQRPKNGVSGSCCSSNVTTVTFLDLLENC